VRTLGGGCTGCTGATEEEEVATGNEETGNRYRLVEASRL